MELFIWIVGILAFIGVVSIFALVDSLFAKNKIIKTPANESIKSEITKEKIDIFSSPKSFTKKVSRKDLLAAIRAMQDGYIYITFLDNNQILINDSKINLTIKDLGNR